MKKLYQPTIKYTITHKGFFGKLHQTEISTEFPKIILCENENEAWRRVDNWVREDPDTVRGSWAHYHLASAGISKYSVINWEIEVCSIKATIDCLKNEMWADEFLEYCAMYLTPQEAISTITRDN